MLYNNLLIMHRFKQGGFTMKQITFFYQLKSNKNILLCILLLFLFSIFTHSSTLLHASEFPSFSIETFPSPTEELSLEPEMDDSAITAIPDATSTESPISFIEPTMESMIEESNIETSIEDYVVEPFSGNYYVTSSGGLNVRSGPSIQYDIIGSLPYGEKVSITGKVQNTWFELYFQQTLGYISAKHLSKEQPSIIMSETTEIQDTLENITEESLQEPEKNPFISDTSIILLLFAIATMIIIIIITVISFFYNNQNQ